MIDFLCEKAKKEIENRARTDDSFFILLSFWIKEKELLEPHF